ncbi:MAG: hypothetical protein H7839_21930 [Magnetococcus sp. YQC-5]
MWWHTGGRVAWLEAVASGSGVEMLVVGAWEEGTAPVRRVGVCARQHNLMAGALMGEFGALERWWMGRRRSGKVSPTCGGGRVTGGRSPS